jgi:hypothetical protein
LAPVGTTLYHTVWVRDSGLGGGVRRNALHGADANIAPNIGQRGYNRHDGQREGQPTDDIPKLHKLYLHSFFFDQRLHDVCRSLDYAADGGGQAH